MGEPSTTGDYSPPDIEYPAKVLGLRNESVPRAALRAGGIDSMAFRAYPYLATYWDGAPYLLDPLRLHASAVANFLNIPQATGGGGIGVMTHRLKREQLLSEETAAARLVSVQQMPLRNAHRVFFSLLSLANRSSIRIDWFALYRTYRSWDHPDRTIRVKNRRQVLEEFYAPPVRSLQAHPIQPSESK